ncbi:MAG: transposase [Balneolaceae bacterium]|nr:transposase [Balneolaceae bacterium]
MSRRRTYSKEYKLDVIQQSYQRDNIRELADELGLILALSMLGAPSIRRNPSNPFRAKVFPAGLPKRTSWPS